MPLQPSVSAWPEDEGGSAPDAQHATHTCIEHGTAADPAQQAFRAEQPDGGHATHDDQRAAHEIARGLDAAIHPTQVLLDLIHGLEQLPPLYSRAQPQLGMLGTELVETLAHGGPATAGP